MTSIHTTNSRGSTHDSPAPPQAENRSIPSLMLLPLAFVQARLFWVYSVIWTLYARLSSDETLPMPPQPQQQPHPPSSAQGLVGHSRVAALKTSRRSRGHSAPPPSQAPVIQEQRARGSTISTESPSTSYSARRVLVPNDPGLLRPQPQDERNGTTCPPQWWQKTRFYLDARKQQQQQQQQRHRSRSPSHPLHGPSTASMSDPSLPLPRFSESAVDGPTKNEPTTVASDQLQPSTIPPPDPAASPKRAQSKRKRLLDLLNHHHRHHHPTSGKQHFWKKKTGPAPAL